MLIAYLPGEPRKLIQQEAAAQLGSTDSAIKSEVYRIKKAFGQYLRAEVAETVKNPVELDDESRYLAEVVSR